MTLVANRPTANTGDGKDSLKCCFCGHEGVPDEFVRTDTLDYTGHTITVDGCKDLNLCFDRGGNTKPVYY
jgi:hypothetical protein